MITRTRLGIALAVIALGLVACGGDGAGAAPTGGQATTTAAGVETTTTSQAAPAELTRATFPSGASVEHPADWISYGVGASSGSLELAIPQTANVSLRDAAASEYLYGPLFADAGSLPGAMASMAALLGVSDVTAETFTSDSGREILYATAEINGADSLFAVTASEAAYASVFAPSLAGPLSPDTVATILGVLASITP
ncbi:MAG: hypothetical protein FJW79_09710 [Actinobacteria bacterium]|nr:hypothetical protein [Actinomycetota bacterium]